MMADHIPFVNSGNDLKRLREYYDRPALARVQLSSAASLRKRQIHHACSLWIDPEIDGCHHLLKRGDARPDWRKHISQFRENEILANKEDLRRPDCEKVKTFVYAVLNKCRQFEPAWITIPQLPITGDCTRNKMNSALAKASGSWRIDCGYDGRLVLPLIFTHQSQLKGKTQWGPKIRLAKKCFDVAGSDIIWAVDCDLLDWKGSNRYRDRFASIVRFHTDLRNTFPTAEIVAGPYWGMNLVLWGRGLCDHPAISLGHGFSYRVAGGYIPPEPPIAMVALGPLRRLARHSEELGSWLENVISGLHHSDEAAKLFTQLRSAFGELKAYEISRNQVAAFYGQWLRRLNAIPSGGRSLALYQDLSSAYVLGKQLRLELGTKAGNLPKSEAPAQEPGKVAEQLMLHCL